MSYTIAISGSLDTRALILTTEGGTEFASVILRVPLAVKEASGNKRVLMVRAVAVHPRLVQRLRGIECGARITLHGDMFGDASTSPYGLLDYHTVFAEALEIEPA